jgi:hypothetical protein
LFSLCACFSVPWVLALGWFARIVVQHFLHPARGAFGAQHWQCEAAIWYLIFAPALASLTCAAQVLWLFSAHHSKEEQAPMGRMMNGLGSFRPSPLPRPHNAAGVHAAAAPALAATGVAWPPSTACGSNGRAGGVPCKSGSMASRDRPAGPGPELGASSQVCPWVLARPFARHLLLALEALTTLLGVALAVVGEEHRCEPTAWWGAALLTTASAAALIGAAGTTACGWGSSGAARNLPLTSPHSQRFLGAPGHGLTTCGAGVGAEMMSSVARHSISVSS